MKRKIFYFMIFLSLSRLPSFTNGYASLQKSTTDWIKGYITSTGISEVAIDETGKPADYDDQEPVSMNRARMIGYDRARDIAMEKISSELKNIIVEYDVALRDFLEENSEIQFRLSKLIDSRIKIKNFPADFNKSGCQARLKISDLLSVFPYEYPAEEFPTIHNNPISTEYTGLIIDVRNLNIRPMLFPVIYNEDGLEIYGRIFIDIKTASRHGIVSYAYNDDDAAASGRIGPRPYYAVAIKKYNGSPVLSNRDTKKILSSGKTLTNLKKCKVIFILDRV